MGSLTEEPGKPREITELHPVHNPETIEVAEMKIGELISAVEQIIDNKNEQIQRYKNALSLASLPTMRKEKEIQFYREALEEIRDIALASEGVEFYAMLAERALTREGFDDT